MDWMSVFSLVTVFRSFRSMKVSSVFSLRYFVLYFFLFFFSSVGILVWIMCWRCFRIVLGRFGFFVFLLNGFGSLWLGQVANIRKEVCRICGISFLWSFLVYFFGGPT